MKRGQKFRDLVRKEAPLQTLGAVNGYFALLAESAGAKSLYLSGGGVAACSLGIPDLGITTMEDVLTDAKRITNVSSLPLLVDIDVGWGGAFNISRTIKEMERAEVAAVHLDDQIEQKRCGHRPNKELVSTEEMCDRIKACVDARTDESFVIMARTDSLANEGLDRALERMIRFKESGADMIFPEAVTEAGQYKKFVEACGLPVLANITEFGKTPLFTKEEMREAGVSIMLYPLSAFRSMAKAAQGTYSSIIEKGHQRDVLDKMQTRDELYQIINYHSFEQKLDQLFSKP